MPDARIRAAAGTFPTANLHLKVMAKSQVNGLTKIVPNLFVQSRHKYSGRTKFTKSQFRSGPSHKLDLRIGKTDRRSRRVYFFFIPRGRQIRAFRYTKPEVCTLNAHGLGP